jgi:hypothetical protein
MSFYREDREWSDQRIIAVQNVIGRCLGLPAGQVSVAPEEMDVHQATDLVVFSARDIKIAARVRRSGFAQKYPFEFTVRSHRNSGMETEYSKIMNGWGDWLFYGHDFSQQSVYPWQIINLNAFRYAVSKHAAMPCLRCGDKGNGDGTFFKWFDIRSFPKERPCILVRSSDPVPGFVDYSITRAGRVVAT